MPSRGDDMQAAMAGAFARNLANCTITHTVKGQVHKSTISSVFDGYFKRSSVEVGGMWRRKAYASFDSSEVETLSEDDNLSVKKRDGTEMDFTVQDIDDRDTGLVIVELKDA